MRTPEWVAAALRALPRPRCAFAYDTSVVRAQAQRLRAVLGDKTVLLYAVKANGNASVVNALAGACDGLDVASRGELDLAVAAGARRIVVSGPAKTDDLLAAAVRAGAQINVESHHELLRLPAGARIAIRVNRRGAALPGSHAMTGTPTPFGVDESELPALIDSGRTIEGFHLHAVSNNLDADAHAAFVNEAVAWSKATAAAFGIELRTVNVGGGLGVDYLTDATIDLDLLGAKIEEPGVELLVEPGRILTADAGWYAAEVLDLKRTHGRWFAVLRGGTHHFRLPAAWGYSHPFTVLPIDQWPYGWPRPEVRDAEVDAVGELCTPRDVLARGQHVDRLRIGDVLVFGRAGAYGWDISHHEFLRHEPPEFLIR
jgi:diaminopimelate decarboxylase